LRWKRTQDFPGKAEHLAPSSVGIVVGAPFLHVGWSNEPRVFLDLVDPATGASKWAKPIEIKGVSPFIVRGDTIFQPVHGGFRAFEAASGKTLSESDVPALGGSEEPLAIESLANGDFVLVSPQNLLAVDPSGRTKYHRYLKAPGSSLLTKVAAVSFSVALTAASGMPAVFYPAQHHATRDENQYAYIYTGQLLETSADSSRGGGFDLVRLDKRDGKEKGRVRLADRTPRYIVDPFTGFVITMNGHELMAYRFPER
jgi:hypothetical protein